MKKSKVSVIDCTVRDGGLMNKWQFTMDQVKEIAQANTAAGVDYMEIGYRASTDVFSPEEYGPWRFCNEVDLEPIAAITKGKVKLSMMVDIGRTMPEDILPFEDSVIDTVRIACYAAQISEATEMANHTIGLGYETFLNIMAITNEIDSEIISCLQEVDKIKDLKGIYVVDSFGSMSMARTVELVQLYKKYCPNLEIGFHGHNNLQLALANTLCALENGVTYADASFFGMGRGAGNCPLELILPQINANGYKVEHVMEVIEKWITKLHAELHWGYHMPYICTGLANSHPSSGINYIKAEKKSSIKDFYHSLMTKEVITT